MSCHKLEILFDVDEEEDEILIDDEYICPAGFTEEAIGEAIAKWIKNTIEG